MVVFNLNFNFRSKSMKNIIVGIGSKLLDIACIIACVCVIVSGVAAMFMQGGFSGFLYGLFVIIGGLCLVIISFFTIYILVDIRDKLTEISQRK